MSKQILFEIEIDSKKAIENVGKLTKEIVALENTQKELKKSVKEGTTTEEDYSEALEFNKKTLASLRKERSQNISIVQNAASVEERLNEVLGTEAKTINDLKKRNSELIKIRDDVDRTTEEGAKQIEELNAIVKQNTDIIKGNNEEAGRFQDNVGNYKSAFEALPAPLKSTSEGVKGLGSQLKTLLANPIVAIFAAIAGVLITLFKAFKQTEEGSLLLDKAFAQITATIDAILGRLGKLANTIVKIFKGEAGLKDLKGSFKGLGDEIKETVEQAGKIVELERSIAKLKNTTVVAVAEYNKVAEAQAAIADDATLSFQKRIEADEKARKASEQRGKAQLDLARQELDILNLRVQQNQRAGKFDQELLNQQAQAKAALIDVETEFTRVVFDNAKRRREINQDNFEQQLDFLIDTADNQKTINERLLTDTRKSLEERKQILEETQKVVNDSFKQQIELFEGQFDIQLETNKLLELNNNESFEYARGLGLSEIATNRLLEVIRDRRMATQDLSDAQKTLGDEEDALNQRRKDAILELTMLEQEKLLKDEESWAEQFELREEQIELEFEREKLAKELLDEELMLLEAEKQIALDELKEEFAEKERERQTQLLEEQIQNFDNILNAAGQFSDERLGIATNLYSNLQMLSDDLKNKRITDEQATKEAISLTTQGLTDFVTSLSNQQLENLKANKDAEVQKYMDAGLSKEEAEKKFQNDVAEAELKAFRLQKAASIAGVAIQTALAISKAIAAAPITGGLPFSAIVAGLGAAQAAIIASKKPPAKPTFAEGGKLPFGGALLGGRYHRDGGTPIFAGNQFIGEAEKNEGLFITNRAATASLLSSVNKAHGGRSFFDKGVSFAQDGGRLNGTDVGQAVRDALKDVVIVTRIEDVSTGITKRNRVLQNKTV